MTSSSDLSQLTMNNTQDFQRKVLITLKEILVNSSLFKSEQMADRQLLELVHNDGQCVVPRSEAASRSSSSGSRSSFLRLHRTPYLVVYRGGRTDGRTAIVYEPHKTVAPAQSVLLSEKLASAAVRSWLLLQNLSRNGKDLTDF